MTKSNLRIAIVILTLATAGIHLYLDVRLGVIDPAFTLNGLGYLALLVIFLKWIKLPFLEGRDQLVLYAFIGFAGVTILAWIALGEKNIAAPLGMIGYTDKLIEVLLIASLWFYGRDRHTSR